MENSIIFVTRKRIGFVMTKRHYTTIKDIAQEVGMSTSTVSRALSDSWDINPETRDKVLSVANRLNYKPNVIAQKLRNRCTKTIGVVVPELINSFFPKVIMGIQGVLNDNGYQLLITQSSESAEQEERNIHMLEDNMVDGFIISPTNDTSNSALYQEILDSDIPIVFFNRANGEIAAPKVMAEDHKMAQEVVRHLYDVGCRNIAHISGPQGLHISELRMSGYLAGLEECGLERRDELIINGGVDEDLGYAATKELLESGREVDGIFVFSDSSAIGVISAIKDAGLAVPEDIAVVGFSDLKIASMVEPKLSTVRQSTFEMGVVAANLILEILNNEGLINVNQTVYIDSELVIRASSNR